MPKSFDIHQIMLLNSQKAIKRRLKKGDFITIGKELLPQLKEILSKNDIIFETNSIAIDAFQVTIK